MDFAVASADKLARLLLLSLSPHLSNRQPIMAISEKQPLIPHTFKQSSAPDAKSHYTACVPPPSTRLGPRRRTAHSPPPRHSIVMGAGLSGMASAIQLKRKLGLEDVLV